MATNKLKPKFCDNAPTGNHFDGEGMYLMVKPDGKKYWRMQCRVNGKRKLLHQNAQKPAKTQRFSGFFHPTTSDRI